MAQQHQIKGIRREQKRLKKRYGMKVVGKGVFTIEQQLGKRARNKKGTRHAQE